jgi:hypothetical protein
MSGWRHIVSYISNHLGWESSTSKFRVLETPGWNLSSEKNNLLRCIAIFLVHQGKCKDSVWNSATIFFFTTSWPINFSLIILQFDAMYLELLRESFNKQQINKIICTESMKIKVLKQSAVKAFCLPLVFNCLPNDYWIWHMRTYERCISIDLVIAMRLTGDRRSTALCLLNSETTTDTLHLLLSYVTWNLTVYMSTTSWWCMRSRGKGRLIRNRDTK